ncbi:MAG: BTAD domain-containing putative transcriptional regulator [Actinomycetota bacterium]|jgi:predicted ATPase/DNA-binding SARP family transcriptional activator
MARQSHPAGPSVRVDVLGPLRLAVDGVEVDVPGPRRRAVLARLALAGGRSVSVDELLADVWPDEMPDSGKRALHSHIARLRRHLGPAGERLERTPNGYRLRLAAGELDAADVPELAARARERLGAGDPAQAVALLRRALDQWRGAPLDEFPEVASLAAEAVQLVELRNDLEDDLLAARLALGGDPDLAGDALRWAAARPLRERTHLLATGILARDGRQADAMRLAHQFRVRLAETTGFDPTPAFAALERAVAVGELADGPPEGPVSSSAATAPAGASLRTVRPPTPLVGRSHELASLRHLVDSQRLVTVVGPGGIGKTRLAMEVAADLSEDGGGDARPVAVVELAVIDDPAHLSDALRAALALRTPANEDVLAAAVGVLAGGRSVMVLDNCEHLVAACRDLADALVGACPELTVLATSREPLGLAGEHVLRLGPLPVPGPEGGPPDLLATIPAVRAFTEYAARRCTGFAATAEDLVMIGEIVRRLDGLPLAVELAAGRVGVLGLGELNDRLGRALDILSAPRAAGEQRHRTLRSTIEWSYRLLPEAEQRLFGALSVFPAGFDLEAVEHMAAVLGVADDPAALLANLVDASMVVADTSDATRPARYSMLETIRAFGGEQLSLGGERDTVDVALVEWAAAVASAIGSEWRGPGEPAAGARLRRELANLRAARPMALERALIDPLVTVTLQLHQLSIFRGLPELWEWALELAARPEIDNHPARPGVLGAAASAAANRGEFDRATKLAEDALRCSAGPGDRYRARHSLARVALARAQPVDARRWWLEAGAEDSDTVPTYAASAALAAAYAGDLDDAGRLIDAARADAEKLGAPGELAFCEYVRGEIAVAAAEADPVQALTAYESAITLARQAGAPFVEGIAAVGRVSVLARTGRIPEALAGYGALIEHWRRGGTWTQLWATLRNLAVLLAGQGQATAAALLLAAADEAPDSPTVAEPHATELEAAVAELRAELGEAGLRTLQDRARSLRRPEVLDIAFAAIAAEPAAT